MEHTYRRPLGEASLASQPSCASERCLHCAVHLPPLLQVPNKTRLHVDHTHHRPPGEASLMSQPSCESEHCLHRARPLLQVPKKTRLYVEQTQRERDMGADMHRMFQVRTQRCAAQCVAPCPGITHHATPGQLQCAFRSRLSWAAPTHPAVHHFCDPHLAVVPQPASRAVAHIPCATFAQWRRHMGTQCRGPVCSCVCLGLLCQSQ